MAIDEKNGRQCIPSTCQYMENRLARSTKAGKFMDDHRDKKFNLDKPGKQTTSLADAERRDNERHLFTAAAEVAELSSGAKFATRTTDLASGGCFVDTIVPFPIGSKVQVSVQKNSVEFEARGVVVYSQSGLGMGIAFDALEPQQSTILERWLTELAGGVPAPHDDILRALAKPLASREHDQSALVRLIQLMIAKRILTESEGASVLNDPVF